MCALRPAGLGEAPPTGFERLHHPPLLEASQRIGRGLRRRCRHAAEDVGAQRADAESHTLAIGLAPAARQVPEREPQALFDFTLLAQGKLDRQRA